MAKCSGNMDTEPERTVKAEIEKQVNISFLEDRKFELFVNGKQYNFLGTQSQPFPAKDLDHPDFLQQKKNFSISYISKGENV